MAPPLAVLLSIALVAQGESPRAIVRHAVAAVEGDSVAAVRNRWTRAAARSPQDRTAVLGLATLARHTYDYATADSLYGLLLADSTTAADVAAVYAALGRGLSARTRGAQRDAAQWFERAWTTAQPSGDRAAQAEALVMAAATRVRTAGPAAAESLYRQARALAAGDTQLEALYHCGHAEMLTLSFQSAAEDARRGAELATQAGDGRLAAACYHYLGSDLGRQGGFGWARTAYERAVGERRRLKDRAGLATSLQWRGYMLRSIGWLEDARRDLEEGVIEARASGNASAEAWSLMNLALIALAVGDAPSGARIADTAEALFSAQGDRYAVSLVLGVRGGIAMISRDYAGARRALLAALASATQVQDRASVVLLHTYLAHIAMHGHDWAEAARELEAARVVAVAANMLGRLNALSYQRGQLALRAGRLDEAERELRPALNRVVRSMGQPDWDYYYRMRLAELYARRGELARAESLAIAGTESLDTWRSTLTQRQMRLLAFQVVEDQSDPDLGLATIIATLARAGRVEAAFGLAERLRARELRDHLARAEGLASVDTTRDTKAGSSALVQVASHRDIAAALPDGRTALLEFSTGRGGEPTTVFVLTRDALRARVVAPIDSLEPLIERFGRLLESGADPRALARELGTRLLDSALAELPDSITRLIVVPDGALHRLPLEALVLPDGRYLIERYAIGVTPSATVMMRLRQTERPTRGPARVLALADPALPSASAAAVARAGPDFTTLQRLPASRREARLVGRFAAHSTVRLGGSASEAWLKQATLTDYRVLHFATHARADEATLAGTAIALASGDGEDGLLGPGELGRLRTDADLVVLSACASGGGVVVRGEGIVGLAAPLLEAGARAIALTRWTISDQSTVGFIDRFYRALAAGEPVADAMRSAKIAAIAAGATPAQWAAFTVVGDPTVTVPLTLPRRRPAPWSVALGLAVVATGLLLWRRARSVVRA